MTDHDTSAHAAVRAADRWWFHDAHGLHDDTHHAAHRPLDLCVPLLALTNDLREIRDAECDSYHEGQCSQPENHVPDWCQLCQGRCEQPWLHYR